MFSTFTRFFGPRHEVCDCCNHFIDIELLLAENELAERKTLRKKLKNLLASLRWKRLKEKYKSRKASARKTFRKRFRHVHEGFRRLGKKRTFQVRRRQSSQAAHAVTEQEAGKRLPLLTIKIGNTDPVDPLRSAVRRLLPMMFTDIVESDRPIGKQTHSTTQYFLVHPLADLNPTGSFLSRYRQPPASAFGMDFNLALTFVSRWLQSSLTTLKTLYPNGDHGLQMPFCVLETSQAGANARARALQRRNPGEKVGIATLDFAALQREKLVASATHTFDFLRVPRTDFSCARKLLAWAEGGEDGLSAKALRSAVLTVTHWEDSDVDTDAESMEEELHLAVHTPLPDDKDEEQWAKWMNAVEKKDSAAVSRAASGSSKGTGVATSEIALTEKEYPRFLSL